MTNEVQSQDHFYTATNFKGLIACLLPTVEARTETYKIVVYSRNGVVSEQFGDNYEMLNELVTYNGFTKCSNDALDVLTTTDEWNRNLYIEKWAKKELSPELGFQKYKSDKEVYRLFSPLFR